MVGNVFRDLDRHFHSMILTALQTRLSGRWPYVYYTVNTHVSQQNRATATVWLGTESGHLSNVTVGLVNPAYTSQTCHSCGNHGHRAGRKFSCTRCGVFDADINAAQNIAAAG